MKFRCIVIVVCLLGGCADPQADQELCIDLTESLYAKESRFNLSEICDSLSYIALETSGEALLNAYTMNVKVADGNIFINSDNVLYKFDATGKYVNKLARHGRGPQEFLQIMDFDIDKETHELFLYDNILGKIEVCDTALNPIRTLKGIPHNIHSISIDKNNRLVCSVIRNDYAAQGKEQNALIILDATDGHEVFSRKSRIPSITPKEKSNFIFSSTMTSYQGEIYYKERRSDTYYCLRDSVTEDSAVYRIHVGPAYPAELDYNWARHEEIENYTRLGGAIETPLYIFIYFYPKKENMRLACYDKVKHKLTVFPKKSFPENDIDGGFSPQCTKKADDTTLIQIIPAIKYKELGLNKERFSISEEDNPVLMFMHLKK